MTGCISTLKDRRRTVEPVGAVVTLQCSHLWAEDQVSEQHHRQKSQCPPLCPPPQKLANSKAHTSRFISANLPCNKFKNRLVNIMPFESTRVCLQPIRGVEGSDYINASFIDGYR